MNQIFDQCDNLISCDYYGIAEFKKMKIRYQQDLSILHSEVVTQRCSVKKVFLEILQNSQENTCARVCFSVNCRHNTCNFIKKEALAQAFSCEICKVSIKPFLTEHLWAAASVHLNISSILYL